MASAVLGLTALRLVEPLERAVVGRRPVYHPERMVARWLPALRRRPALLGATAAALRFGYAFTLARGLALARSRLPRSRLLAGLTGGLIVSMLEAALLPATGATPRLRRWRRAELPMLAVHAAAFCLAASTED
jgi:hypothetical protein